MPACSAVKGEFCRIASTLMSIHNLHFKWKLSKLLKLLGILIVNGLAMAHRLTHGLPLGNLGFQRFKPCVHFRVIGGL